MSVSELMGSPKIHWDVFLQVSFNIKEEDMHPDPQPASSELIIFHTGKHVGFPDLC
jgi:hypothetical protein